MSNTNDSETKTRNRSPRSRAAVLSNRFVQERDRAEKFQARADESTDAMDEILAEVEANPEVKAIFDKLVAKDEAPAAEQAPVSESEPAAVAAE